MRAPSPLRARLLAACLAGLLAACSDTMLRRDSLSYVTIDGQELAVSWVELAPDELDLMVGLLPREDGQPLDRATAIQAAGRVAARHCLLDRVHAVFPPVEYAVGRFAFRYMCGREASPPPPPPGFEEYEEQEN